MTQGKYWTLISLVLVLVTGVAGVYVYSQYFLRGGPMAGDALEQARQYKKEAALNSRSGIEVPDYTKTSQLLNQALAVNDDTALEGYLKVELALSMHQAGEGNEGEENHVEGEGPKGLSLDAMNLLKEVGLNEQYAPGARSYAYNTIGDLLINHYNKKTVDDAKTLLFTGPVFVDLLKDGNVPLAIAGVYDLSASYYPTGDNRPYDLYSNIISSYRSANIYLEEILTDKNLTKEQQSTYYQTAQKKISNGDAFVARYNTEVSRIAQTTREERMNGEYRNLGYGARERAGALGKSYLLSEDKSSEKAAAVETEFGNALSILAKSRVFIVRKMEMYTRFDYALWLAEAYGSEASGKIDSVLAPLYADKDANSVAREHIRDQATLIDDLTYEGRGIIVLAQANQNFKLFAKTNGWTDLMLARKVDSLAADVF